MARHYSNDWPADAIKRPDTAVITVVQQNCHRLASPDSVAVRPGQASQGIAPMSSR